MSSYASVVKRVTPAACAAVKVSMKTVRNNAAKRKGRRFRTMPFSSPAPVATPSSLGKAIRRPDAKRALPVCGSSGSLPESRPVVDLDAEFKALMAAASAAAAVEAEAERIKLAADLHWLPCLNLIAAGLRL